MHVAKWLEPLARRLALRTVQRRGNRLSAPIDGTRLARVLVYRPQRFGDMLATLPILRFLKSVFPQWYLELWTSAQGKELLEPEQVTDRIYALSGRTFDRPAGERAKDFDLVIDLVPHDSVNALLACRNAARAGVLAGFGKDRFALYYDWARPYASPDLYAPYAGLGVLSLFGEAPEVASLKLHYGATEQAFAARELGGSPGAIVVNLSARHVWPTDRWAQLLDYLLARFDRPVLVNAVGGDRRRAVGLAAARTAQVRVLPEGATFREVTCLVSRAGLLISPDTSLVHVAAAAGVPTVGLYPLRHDFRLCWIPPGEGVRVIRATAPGTLASISLEQVCRAVDELFAPQPASSGIRP